MASFPSEPIEFNGGLLTDVTAGFGYNSSPSTLNLNVANDPENGKIFIVPTMGSYTEFSVGDFSFQGVFTQVESKLDASSIGISNIQISDVREIMKSIAVTLSPTVFELKEQMDALTPGGISAFIDIFGHFTPEPIDGFGIAVNTSNWNTAGMPFSSIKTALAEQSVSVFGQSYTFDLSEIISIEDDHRINIGDTDLSNLIQAIADEGAFDWYVTSTSGADILITIKTIDRSTNNLELGLQTFIDQFPDRDISVQSGVELRNESTSYVLIGAPQELLEKRNIESKIEDFNGSLGGLSQDTIDKIDAIKVIDLSEFTKDTSKGAITEWPTEYIPTEVEMRAALEDFDTWLNYMKSGSFGRSPWVNEPVLIGKIFPNPKGAAGMVIAPTEIDGEGNRVLADYIGDRVIKESDKEALLKQVKSAYTAIKQYAESIYGKKFIYVPTGAEEISQAWTKENATAGEASVNKFFADDTGRTTCYVEFKTKGTDVGANIIVWSSGIDMEEIPPEDFIVKKQSGATASTLFLKATAKDGIVTLIESITETLIEEESADEKTLRSEIVSEIIANTEFGPDDDPSDQAQQLNELNCEVFNNRYDTELSRKRFVPKAVFIPTRNTAITYGPFFSNTFGIGKVEIIRDDGIAPWEYGGLTNMIEAANFKVNNAGAIQIEAESATVEIEGLPERNLGDSIGNNSNISNISVNFGLNKISTTYTFQAFAKKFGKFRKEDFDVRSGLQNDKPVNRFFAERRDNIKQKRKERAKKSQEQEKIKPKNSEQKENKNNIRGANNRVKNTPPLSVTHQNIVSTKDCKEYKKNNSK